VSCFIQHFTECYYAECHYAVCRQAECHYAECHYAECHYAECHYAECRGAFSSASHSKIKNLRMTLHYKTFYSKEFPHFIRRRNKLECLLPLLHQDQAIRHGQKKLLVTNTPAY
jgi:hypothetical protein